MGKALLKGHLTVSQLTAFHLLNSMLLGDLKILPVNTEDDSHATINASRDALQKILQDNLHTHLREMVSLDFSFEAVKKDEDGDTRLVTFFPGLKLSVGAKLPNPLPKEIIVPKITMFMVASSRSWFVKRVVITEETYLKTGRFFDVF